MNRPFCRTPRLHSRGPVVHECRSSPRKVNAPRLWSRHLARDWNFGSNPDIRVELVSRGFPERLETRVCLVFTRGGSAFRMLGREYRSSAIISEMKEALALRTMRLCDSGSSSTARPGLNDPNRFNRTCQQTLLVSARGSTRAPFINDCIGRRASGATRKYPATFSAGFSLHHGSPGTDIKNERTLVCRASSMQGERRRERERERERASSDRWSTVGKIQSSPAWFAILSYVLLFDSLNNCRTFPTSYNVDACAAEGNKMPTRRLINAPRSHRHKFYERQWQTRVTRQGGRSNGRWGPGWSPGQLPEKEMKSQIRSVRVHAKNCKQLQTSPSRSG